MHYIMNALLSYIMWIVGWMIWVGTGYNTIGEFGEGEGEGGMAGCWEW